MSGLEKEKRLLKCLSKQAPTVCQSETQEPLLSLMKSIALSVLLMIVEVWKNRVFRSLQVNQHSLDLFLHRGSFLLSSSSSSALRVSSMERFEAKGVFMVNGINMVEDKFESLMNVAQVVFVALLNDSFGMLELFTKSDSREANS